MVMTDLDPTELELSSFTAEVLAARPTMHLLNLWFAIMSNQGFKEFNQATPDERGAFFKRLCEEIDKRIPPRK